MKILFLGDIVGVSGCSKIKKNLSSIKKNKDVDFVVANAENADESGVGLTKNICEDLFLSGVNVITTGNHVWDQKELMSFIDKENRLLRPKNLFEPSPGKGFEIYKIKNDLKVGVLNLMGNVFMKKCDDVFETSKRFIDKYKLKEDYDESTSKEVKKIIKKLNINYIDIHEGVFLKEENPLDLFPFGLNGHYNILGFQKISKYIFDKTR